MLATIETSARVWMRARVFVPLTALLAAACGVAIWPSLARHDGVSYVVAIWCGALAVAVSGQLERLAWFHSETRRDATLILSVGALAMLASLARFAFSPLDAGQSTSPGQFLGVVHIAAMALVLRRTPWNPTARAAGLLLLTLVVPALVPPLRPLLDASPLFHAEHFPGLSTALAPILSLIVLAYALPGRHSSSVAGTASP